MSLYDTLAMKEYVEALEACKKSATLQPSGIQLYLQGYSHSNLGQHKHKEATYESARRLGTKEFRVENGLGYSYLRLGETKQAEKHFRTAIAANQDLAPSAPWSRQRVF